MKGFFSKTEDKKKQYEPAKPQTYSWQKKKKDLSNF